jgi:hypothetical protein
MSETLANKDIYTMLNKLIPASLAVTASAQLLKPAIFDNAILRRQAPSSEEAYIASVCTPNSTSLVPPCTEIITIQGACEPNGTLPIDYLAHQQCMCSGSFFSNWLGCLNCQYVHGARSEAEVQAFDGILASASNALCTGTPTASFAAIFSSISEAAPQSASGAATVFSDQFPSMTAISLYFTVTGAQGPGAITGSATAATKAVASSTTSAAGSSATSSYSSGFAVTGTSSASGIAASSASAALSTVTAKSEAVLRAGAGMLVVLIVGLSATTLVLI